MANDHDTPPDGEEEAAGIALDEVNHDSDESSDEGSSSDGEPVEQLYAGRERRMNQGNRYSVLLGQEQAADEGDDLSQLFAEDEAADEEFEGSEVEEDADVEDESSDTDNDDQGPAGGEGELEGEQQLQKEERAAKKSHKRKIDKIAPRPAPTRKKVKIDETASTPEVQEDKRKKSERISWVPTDAPVRTSSRALAVQNKERTTASLRESALKREQAIAIQQAAREKKNAAKARPKTQAEKLEEAARTERINSKSLNKWEEMEQERAKKQKARLEAMHNRKIEGPFIRWISSKGEWADDKLVKVGKVELVNESALKRDPKTPAVVEKTSYKPTEHQGTPVQESSAAGFTLAAPKPQGALYYAAAEPPLGNANATPREASPVQGPVKDGYTSLIEEMQQYASQNHDPMKDIQQSTPNPTEDGLSIPTDDPKSAGDHPPPDATTSTRPTSSSQQSTTDPESTSACLLLSQFQPHQQPLPHPHPTTEHPLPPSPPKQTHHSTHNTLTLHNFAPQATNPTLTRHIILGTPLPSTLPPSITSTTSRGRGRKPLEIQGPPKPQQVYCAVTGQNAKFRDPMTGLPYRDRDAFEKIRRVATGGGGVWSGLLGAWVGGGEVGEVARGMSEGFLGGKIGARGGVKEEGVA